MSAPTMRCEVLSFVDARTGDAHLVTSDAVGSGCRAGRYVTVCGAVVVAASLTAAEKKYCRSCLGWQGAHARGEGLARAVDTARAGP